MYPCSPIAHIREADQFTAVFGNGRGHMRIGVSDQFIEEAAAHLRSAAAYMWSKVNGDNPDGDLTDESMKVQEALKELNSVLVAERGYGFCGTDFTIGLPEYFASGSNINTVAIGYHNEATHFNLFGLHAGYFIMRHEYPFDGVPEKYEWQCRYGNLTLVDYPGLRSSDNHFPVLSIEKDAPSIKLEDRDAALAWLQSEQTMLKALPLAQDHMAARYRLYMNTDLKKYVKGW